MLTVVLDGGFVSFRHGEHATRAGDLLIEREPLWLERWEGRFRALVVEWSEHVAPLLLPGIGRVSREDTARVARWAAELEASEVAPLEVIGSLFEWFSSLGFPRTPWPSLASSLSAAPPVVLQVGAAMARLLDEMHRAPQAVDLVSATALHPRTLQRVFAQHQRWLPMTMAQRAHDLRIVLAGSLLASTSATTRVVAEALGYGSGRALLRALDDACYPTVAELRSGGAV